MAAERRILIRAGKPPHLALSPAASLFFGASGVFAGNAGNMVFSTAVYRHLKTPSTRVVVDGYALQNGLTSEGAARLNDDFDALVLPLADAFRRPFAGRLLKLARLIERLTIPVVVIGIGGKAKLAPDASLDASRRANVVARRFVRAVLERSESIGVRGSYTAEYLTGLGFPEDRIDVIGCPSMFELDHATTIAKPAGLAVDDPLALTLSPYIPGIDRFLTHNAQRYPRLTYLPQRAEDLRLLLWGEPVSGYPEALPADPGHPLYRSGRLAMGVDLSTWSGFLGRQRFAFGTRIHGTITALHAGTPAFLLAHDTRTLELAEYHQIPHLPISQAAEYDARELFDQADFTRYNAVAAERRRTYARFLTRNGLAHTLDGDRDASYDARLEQTRFPAPVGPRRGRLGLLGGRMSAVWGRAEADRAARRARADGDLWEGAAGPAPGAS